MGKLPNHSESVSQFCKKWSFLSSRIIITIKLNMERLNEITKDQRTNRAWCMKVIVTQSCLTVRNPMDSTVQGILQARTLEWVALPFSRGSSQPRDWIQVSHICGRILYQLSHKGSPRILEWVAYPFSSRSSSSRNQTGVSCITGRFFTNWAIRGIKCA